MKSRGNKIAGPTTVIADPRAPQPLRGLLLASGWSLHDAMTNLPSLVYSAPEGREA